MWYGLHSVHLVARHLQQHYPCCTRHSRWLQYRDLCGHRCTWTDLGKVVCHTVSWMEVMASRLPKDGATLLDRMDCQCAYILAHGKTSVWTAFNLTHSTTRHCPLAHSSWSRRNLSTLPTEFDGDGSMRDWSKTFSLSFPNKQAPCPLAIPVCTGGHG